MKFFPIMADKDKSNIDNQVQKETTNLWRRKIEQEYTYCMISTLNQMVNYLPMLLFDFQQPKMYLTITGKGSEQNKSYDHSLYETCRKLLKEKNSGLRFSMPSQKVEIKDFNEVHILQSTLFEAASGKKILWNITGGQRPFIMAIFELLKEQGREHDCVMYFEGNAGKVVFLEVKGKALQTVHETTHGFESYAVSAAELKWLNIKIALQLMGFDAKDPLIPISTKENPIFKRLVRKYVANESLRKKFLALNKAENQTEGETTVFTKDILTDKDVAAYFSELTPDELQKVLCHHKRTHPFGHLLEEMYAHAIYDVAEGQVAEIATNVRLRYSDEEDHEEAGKHHIDELDIAVLTKTGQLVVFEVKSGGMSGDVAKSTKYTTYAIAGVYGKPILLTALLKEQLKSRMTLSRDVFYGSSASAAAAAARAQLAVVCLDGDEDGDFGKVIKDLLNLS